MSSEGRDIPRSYLTAKPRDGKRGLTDCVRCVAASTPLGMSTASKPRRQLGLFDATMIVMGGIVGAGIFANPSEVAHRVHTPFLILGVWTLGGFIAMCGAFVWAELATRLPGTGGQYLYLREAYHPSVAFVYGWGLLLVTQTGGMAAVAVIFASYFRALTSVIWSDSAIAALVLLALTGINCLGARAGSNVQNVLMLLKIGAIAALVVLGQSMLTAPRVYYAMARDGLFFKSVGKLSPRSRAPVVAIVLQGVAATIIACSGTYGEILNFEVTVDFIFFGMTAASLFILRRRQIGSDTAIYHAPGHPFTTILFVLSCAGIVGSAIVASPANSAIALCIMLAALPVYYYWGRFRRDST